MESTLKPVFSMRCEDLSVFYDSTTALEIPDLELAGNTIAVVGHNGAGKSTLLKAALGLLRHRGRIQTTIRRTGVVQDITPAGAMAFCPENGAVFSDVRVEAYIKLWCRIKCNDGNYYRNQGRKFIDLFDIPPLLPKMGRELSKGQRRRVQTAIGYLTNPEVFMFDEPFCGLDIRRTYELQNILANESYHTAVVLASHRMEVVERIADHVVVLEKGAVVASGTAETVASALCGTEYTVRNACDRVALRLELEQHFPTTLISEVGAEIRILGRNLNRSLIAEFIAAKDSNGAVLEDQKPGLVDALQYHFRMSNNKA